MTKTSLSFPYTRGLNITDENRPTSRDRPPDDVHDDARTLIVKLVRSITARFADENPLTPLFHRHDSRHAEHGSKTTSHRQ